MTLIYYQQGHRYSQSLEPKKVFQLKESAPRFWQEGEAIFYESDGDKKELTDRLTHEGVNYYPGGQDSRIYSIAGEEALYLAKAKGADLFAFDLTGQALLERTGKGFRLCILSGYLYVNNFECQVGIYDLTKGDELAFGASLLSLQPEEIWVSGQVVAGPSLVQLDQSAYQRPVDFPDYHRSPRLIYRPDAAKFAVTSPPAEITKPKDELLRLILPPLASVGLVVLISILQPRGLYILVTMGMSVVTLFFSVSNYFKNRKQYGLDVKEREKSYERYLMDKAIELRQADLAYQKGQTYHYPAISELDKAVDTYSPRVYEKRLSDFDALTYRIGLAELKNPYSLTYNQMERSGLVDPLEQRGYRLYHSHLTQKDLPLSGSLMEGQVGYVGDRKLVTEQLQLLVSQLAFFHSYHDLNLIVVLPEREKDDWAWARFLPHLRLTNINVRGLVYNQATRDMVLTSLTQILKERQNRLDQKEKLQFLPHFVLLVLDETLILDHTLMDFLDRDTTPLGLSVVYVQDDLSALSEEVTTVITLKDKRLGQLVMRQGVLLNQIFTLDYFPEGFDKEKLPRYLAGLNHLETLKSSIPDSVSFLEMYQAKAVEDLDIRNRWSSHAPYQSLAVPLGLRGKDDLVELNLHEKAHGPHGLIAGTTGSGKSELIQSYILSLAVNFHPHDVGFLLIDYKGGGMANLFKDLPHLLGTITNLDGNASLRALASIRAELARRQALFAEQEVNHINQYQKKFKEGQVTEPLPHLFIISDEFAELKVNQPDFMAELVSTARIGRSLGVHLILATQKPAGVVSDQIWSNSTFRIALKVADRQDSSDVLHTPDAAEITQTGRAYLQVGNNEVYELFQSAYSGADYQPDKDSQDILDETIYAVNDLGQLQPLTQDLSGLDQATAINQIPTELEAVVQAIKTIVTDDQITPVARPWLEPLGEEIYLQTISQPSANWSESVDYQAVYGVVDSPSKQEQYPLVHDFEDRGHIALFSGPGMGKTTFLETIVMDIARKNSPARAQFYLMDYGASGLLRLLNLPHATDLVYTDDIAKTRKLIERIQTEIKKRKALFTREMVSSLSAYEFATKQKLPRLFFVIDSYEGIKGTALEAEVDSFLATISRDGTSLGLYLVISTGRLYGLKTPISSNIKTKISLLFTDETESRNIVGRHAYPMEDLPGRGLIKLDQVEVLQIALSVYGENDLERLANLRQEISQMDENWDGARPETVPIVPEVLSVKDFLSRSQTKGAIKQGALPLGLEYEEVSTVSIAASLLKHLHLVWEKKVVRRGTFCHLVEMIDAVYPQAEIVVYDNDQTFDEDQQWASSFITESHDLKASLHGLKNQMIRERQQGNFERRFIFFTDLVGLIEQTGLSEQEFAMMYEEGLKVGMHFIFATTRAYTHKRDTLARYLLDRQDMALITCKMTEQSFYQRSQTGAEPVFQPDQMYFHANDEQVIIKITK
ncbi:type VII secretion protein EssC [Streptococcus sp. DD12]|uniref:type VII secretion protein EssC n=1 Tax=Streptococcus sp. DD12 TaxID=1777880 RepID=UPI00079968B2|nr:type VII secretion protein EssC [Streptococcus sp. DD12]KXT75906.1 FtsK/SpoIIIE family protein, putative secretion system component EssC/YukA [Streptococcus sp. DD12]